jgi:hypothetical protein
MQKQQGLVAILDALGASNYKGPEIAQFQKSRKIVLDELRDKAIRILGRIDSRRVTTFTFNDTVVIVHRTEEAPRLQDVEAFGEMIRKFEIRSLANGILFRGSIAIGQFYVNSRTNTVMGDAVADAAAWYERADWIGIAATPHATLVIQSLIEQGHGDIGHLMIDYSVPIKDKLAITLKAVNWPKAFFVRGMTPCVGGDEPRAKCLSLLAQHGVPSGTESKYLNSIKFFDHCAGLWQKERRNRRARTT